mmetsp:Transcript_26378/g.35140  ORF Transcript_26378/g.35140 Transcript_26378/m.35140 type:complete len:332 (+) Transcript_26378:76-1071(+)
MFGGFKASKLKPQLKMAVSRFQIASNKKTAILKQQMREIAMLLSETPTPKEEKARIRAETLIREDNTIEAYEILQLECELLCERIKLIASCKECPPDLVSCVSTLIWATDRVDIVELVEVRKQFRSKYGKKFEEAALKNIDGCLNERVVAKLSVEPPSAYLVQTYLEKIAQEYDISWTPMIKLNGESAVAPMVAPVGESVPSAPGTGYGEAHTGQQHIDKDMYMPPGGGGGGPPPMAHVMPIPPPAVPDDDDEPDIFVPAAPSNRPGGGRGGGGGGGTTYDDMASLSGPTPIPFVPQPPSTDNRDDDDDNNGGNGGASYDDLAARFAALQK